VGSREKNGKLIPCVFPGWDGKDKARDFGKAWGKACANAEIGKSLVHEK
jgi:hypothetical protein